MICENCGQRIPETSDQRQRFCSRACFIAHPVKIEAERFWSRVSKSEGCWLWLGKQNKLGYGQFWAASQKGELAHRAAWRMTNGPIPSGQILCHRCDNPACVRPDHLFLGTFLDNYHDCKRKGRTRHHHWGRRNGNVKLTDEQIDVIRRRYIRGVTRMCDLAKEFGVSTGYVSQILSRDHIRPAPLDWSAALLGFGA